MNAQSKLEPPDGLALLRQPFPEHQISKLPKPTKAQNEAVKADYKKGIRCKICGGWHHPEVVHLDYVGHAALTDRLLDVDAHWSWEPVAFNQHGLPALDGNGGLWIRLTIQGVTRLGYGDADGKTGGNAIKEAIGDALRNASMRFGAALDLWHKGDLHVEVEQAIEGQGQNGAVSPQEPSKDYAFPDGPATGISQLKNMVRGLWREVAGCGDDSELLTLLETQEAKNIMAQCDGLENPAHREIWEGDGKDNPGLSGLIAQRKDEFKTRDMNIISGGKFQPEEV